MGDIYKNSLLEIWEKNEILKKLRNHTEGCFEECINCEASDFCFRCFARNFTETGSITVFPEYACEIAFLSKRLIDKFNNNYVGKTIKK